MRGRLLQWVRLADAIGVVQAPRTCRSWAEQFQNLQRKMLVHRAVLLRPFHSHAHGLDMPFVHFWGVINLDVPFYYVWGCLVVGCQALELNERWHFYPPSLELLVAHFGDWS